MRWSGRDYKRDRWGSASPINRALSTANSCLYGVCHAAIVSAGYSPALGFIHTGKMLSFVYDVADLYKADVTIPLAFRVVAAGEDHLETRTRYACREIFRVARILARVVPDIDRVLRGREVAGDVEESDFDMDDALPSGLWAGGSDEVEGGVNWGDGGSEG